MIHGPSVTLSRHRLLCLILVFTTKDLSRQTCPLNQRTLSSIHPYPTPKDTGVRGDIELELLFRRSSRIGQGTDVWKFPFLRDCLQVLSSRTSEGIPLTGTEEQDYRSELRIRTSKLRKENGSRVTFVSGTRRFLCIPIELERRTITKSHLLYSHGVPGRVRRRLCLH